VTAFGSAAIGGIAAVALIEDLRYFAEGSPESFWSTWHIHPVLPQLEMEKAFVR
jgi:hypothetical protein